MDIGSNSHRYSARQKICAQNVKQNCNRFRLKGPELKPLNVVDKDYIFLIIEA